MFPTRLPRAMRVPPRLDPTQASQSYRAAASVINQSVLSQGPARQLRQARADADAGADEHRRRDARRLGRSRYWDENLLQGPPPRRAVPAGRRHHRASDVRRAGLSSWRAGIASAGRRWCSAGCTCCRAPTKRAPHADALAIGEGVQVWPRDPPRRRGGHAADRATAATTARPYRDDPPPRRDLLPRGSFLTTTQPDRHARLPQPLRVLLPGDRRPAHALPDARRRAGRRRVRAPTASPTRVFIDNNLGSRPRLPARAVPRAAAAGEDLERRGDAST